MNCKMTAYKKTADTFNFMCPWIPSRAFAPVKNCCHQALHVYIEKLKYRKVQVTKKTFYCQKHLP